jgi:hypothetical protein
MGGRMSRAVVLALLTCVGATIFVAAEAATVRHTEPLRGYRVASTAGSGKPAPTDPATLAFNAFSRDFTLELEPNGRLAALQASLDLPAGTGAYRGKVAGRPGSWARIVLTDAGPTGLVFDGATLYGIESGSDSATPAAAPAMFRLADVYFAPGELGCEIRTAEIDGAQAVTAMAQEFTALAAEGATLNLDLGAVADFEFSQTFGANTEAALLTRFNNIDGIYSEQLGVQITVTEIDIFDVDNDPFTTNVPSTLLDELANYRGATPAQDANGLTHLFTGRDLDGSTAGIAFLGAVCAQRTQFDTRSFGAGLSEGRRGAILDSLVAAHEIGHNFGAPHDGEANTPCASTPLTFLMASNINGNDQFSACSIAEMQEEIASASCLTPLGPADLALRLARPPQPAHANVSFNQTATVTNLGADPTTNVVFNATATPGLEILSATSGTASCTVTPASASCALGTIGGGGSRGIALALRAPAPGSYSLAANVTADSDAFGGNNNAALTIDAVPAVDLVLTGSAGSVTVDEQTAIDTMLLNASDFDATSVAVSATLSAGLRPDEATLGGAACTITGQTIACSAPALGARASVAFAVTATGTAVGGQLVTVNATASQVERAPADNQLNLNVNVTAVGADDGGGGALSWWVVGLLLAGCAWRAKETSRRRRPFYAGAAAEVISRAARRDDPCADRSADRDGRACDRWSRRADPGDGRHGHHDGRAARQRRRGRALRRDATHDPTGGRHDRHGGPAAPL